MNGRIILKAFPGLLGTDVLADLAAHHPALRAGEDSVSLHVAEKDGLDRDASRAVLAPDRELQANKSYALTFNPPFEGSDGDALQRLGRKSNWTTGSAVDRSPPRWLSRPKAATPVYERHGLCSFNSYVEISVAVSEASWIRVERREQGEHADRRWRRSFHFPASDGIRVNLSPEERYTIKLTAVDLAGNESKAPGPPIEVTMPSREVANRK